MPAAALKLRKSDDVQTVGPSGRSLTLVRPVDDSAALIEWARAVTADADRRVELLERRLSYLETLVGNDELTGLLNRRGFLSIFARVNAAAKRGGPGGVIVVCDLDGFKKVNDALGHAQGDELLRRLGGIFRRKTRKMDAAARLGGDEFALMLIGVSPSAARRKCQWLDRVIGTIGIRASFGLAPFDGEESEDIILHRADMAMYAEKRRNRALADNRD